MLRRERGYIGLSGPRIDAFVGPHYQRHHHYHITLFSKAEIREHNISIDQLPTIHEEELDLVDVGTGQSGEETFKVILWPRGDQIRRECGLPPKDFHITITGAAGAAYNPDTQRGIQSLLSHPPADTVFDACTDATFDRVYAAYTKAHMTHEAYLSVKKYMAAHPLRPAGFIRYGDLLFSREEWKMAMLLFAHAASLNGIKPSVLDYCIVRICRCAQYTELGPLFTETELQLSNDTEDTPSFTITTWPASLRQRIAQNAASISLSRVTARPSREKLMVMPDAKWLPRFFQWLVPFAIAFMSTPRHKEDIALLDQALNIGLVVTLTTESPLDGDWFQLARIQNLFVPIENYRAPTLAQVEHIFSHAIATFKSDRAVLIHCGGGKGRAGTVAACWLVRFGFTTIPQESPVYSATEAIRIIRQLRPGSIETIEQEQFVAAYARHLWHGQKAESADTENADLHLRFEGHFNLATTSMIILCGLPGSGKSWLAQQIKVRTTKRHAIIVSGDELGGIAECQEMAAEGLQAGHMVVVDRCNPLPSDRAVFTQLTHGKIGRAHV